MYQHSVLLNKIPKRFLSDSGLVDIFESDNYRHCIADHCPVSFRGIVVSSEFLYHRNSFIIGISSWLYHTELIILCLIVLCSVSFRGILQCAVSSKILRKSFGNPSEFLYHRNSFMIGTCCLSYTSSDQQTDCGPSDFVSTFCLCVSQPILQLAYCFYGYPNQF